MSATSPSLPAPLAPPALSPAPMPMPMLRSLAPLLIEGADARALLQGQISNDVRRLTPQRALLASCNSAQGRVQCVLTLMQRDEGFVALVPASMVTSLLARLRPYVLRAKVAFHPDPECWALSPVSRFDAVAVVGTPPGAPGECLTLGGVSVLRWWSADERYVLLSARGAVATAAETIEDSLWRRADIAAGLPQVYPQTLGSFVAQMLNLDLLNAISFDKGCYAGQEIIARTHYRGSIKRRMFRFSAACAAPDPGTRVLDGAVGVGEVVDSVDRPPGAAPPGCELLAVVSLEHVPAALSLDGVNGSTLTLMPLPYEPDPPRVADQSTIRPLERL